VEGLNSNLNLNAGAPPGVQPRLGLWGPERVPSTRAKKRMRWWVSLAFVGVVVVLFLYGWYIFRALQGG
jgi:type VI protein secretion system component VasF